MKRVYSAALLVSFVAALFAMPAPIYGQPPLDLGPSSPEEAASVPEPATLLLLGTGLVGVAFLRRKGRGK